MKIELHYYGRLTEITEKNSEIIECDALIVLDLKNILGQRYPKLKGITFNLAAKNTFLKEEETIPDGIIDVFPPFSGG